LPRLVKAAVVKVTEMDDAMAHPIVSTAGLLINEKARPLGHLRCRLEIVAWL